MHWLKWQTSRCCNSYVLNSVKAAAVYLKLSSTHHIYDNLLLSMATSPGGQKSVRERLWLLLLNFVSTCCSSFGNWVVTINVCHHFFVLKCKLFDWGYHTWQHFCIRFLVWVILHTIVVITCISKICVWKMAHCGVLCVIAVSGNWGADGTCPVPTMQWYS